MKDYELPIVFFHILAKDKAKVLPYWLEQNLNKLDYPRDKVILHFRTNNNNDDTAKIIQDWMDKELDLFEGASTSDWMDHDWKYIVLDDEDVPERVQQYGVHEWNAERFSVLARLREEGIAEAKKWEKLLGKPVYYFVVDVDNFILPGTLKALIAEDKPVIAPLLRYAVAEGEETHAGYANFHHPVTANGYYQDSEEYFALLNGAIRGVWPIDLVHCTYLIHPDILPYVSYHDGTQDYEYVIFSRRLRNAGIEQYLDNRKIYGYLTLHENVDACKYWMGKLTK
jgi:hypothetical protein